MTDPSFLRRTSIQGERGTTSCTSRVFRRQNRIGSPNNCLTCIEPPHHNLLSLTHHLQPYFQWDTISFSCPRDLNWLHVTSLGLDYSVALLITLYLQPYFQFTEAQWATSMPQLQWNASHQYSLYYMYIHQNLLSRGESQSVGTDERNCFIYLCQNVILSYFSCYVVGVIKDLEASMSVAQVPTSVKHTKLGECPVAFDRHFSKGRAMSFPLHKKPCNVYIRRGRDWPCLRHAGLSGIAIACPWDF